MAAVQFSFDEFLSELQSIEDIASSYLESDAAAIFYSFGVLFKTCVNTVP